MKRVCVTDRSETRAADLLPAGEVGPSLALAWIGRLRLGWMAGLSALTAVGEWYFGLGLPLAWLTVPLVLMAGSHLAMRWLARRVGPRTALGLLLLLDTLCLTAVLAVTGGPANPFTLLYLVQITLSAVVLSKEWTWGLGVVSMVCFAGLFPWHAHVHGLEGHHQPGGFSAHLVGMWVAFAAAAMMVTLFIGRLSEMMRQREQEVLGLRDRLARRHHVAGLATLAAGAAHELGTPLATIALVAREMERGGPEAVRDDAGLIRREVDECRRILDGIGGEGVARRGERPEGVALAGLLERVRQGFREKDRARIDVAAEGAACVPVDAVRQVVGALVQNALEAGPGRVWVTGELAGGWVRFRITDEGRGMSEEELSHVAEPYYSTRPGVGGWGLGTYLARVFAEDCQGRLVFESEPGRGTVVTLELPGEVGLGE